MRKDIKALTGIRFFAAFYVFLLHMDMRIPFTFLPEWGRNFVGQGRAGVNVFFVLSGFILTYTYFRKETQYFNFIKKRVSRIYPAYLVGLILCLILLSPFGNIPSPAVFFANIFLLQSYFPGIVMKWYGAGSWSISTEFFFYFLFPFLLPLFLKFSKNILRILLPIFIVTSFAPGLLVNFSGHGTQWAYSFPLFRVSEFICGMIGAILVFKYKEKVSNILSAASVLFLIGFLAFVGDLFPGSTSYNFVIVPVTLLCLASCTDERDRLFKWLGYSKMEYLGKVSYGFYIVQLPLVLLLDELLKSGYVASTDLWLIPVVFVTNILLCIALYELVEMPVHKLATKRKATQVDKFVINEA